MNLILVDDDIIVRHSVGKFLRKTGHHVIECSSGEEALTLCRTEDFPLVISDIRMPGMSGLELLKEIRALPARHTEVVLFTGHGTVESAVEALRAGAFDYLLKPINVEELVVVIDRVAEHQALLRENERLTSQFQEEVKVATQEAVEEVQRLRQIVAKAVGVGEVGLFSPTMKDITRRAEMYNQDRAIPVLIQGETGTGKEVVARMIHNGAAGTSAPFVDINCAALTPSLFESELFGYEAGSFTGGLLKGQKGKLDIAAGGTLFLDEIGEMPLDLQAKLLRVLQEKEFYRVGGLRKVKTDVRIICATNVDLLESVEKGLFRKDLYYRLNVGQITIPPLRERVDSIVPLAEMFLRRFAREKGKAFRAISNSAAQSLCGHSWPGNVRELKNAIEWVVFMYDAPILQSQHLDTLFSSSTAPQATLQSLEVVRPRENVVLPEDAFVLEEYIDKIVAAAIKKYEGNKSAAAAYLGMSRRALGYRVDKLNHSE